MRIDLRLQGPQCQKALFLFMLFHICDLFLDTADHILKAVIQHLRLITGMNGYVQIQIVLLYAAHRIGEDFYVFQETIGQDAAEYHRSQGKQHQNHRIDRQHSAVLSGNLLIGNQHDALPSGYLRRHLHEQRLPVPQPYDHPVFLLGKCAYLIRPDFPFLLKPFQIISVYFLTSGLIPYDQP